MNATCEALEPELIGYHFGTCEPDPRARLEAHLISCAGCVQRYVHLKRALELAEDAPMPSPGIRARIRASVATALRPPPPAWRWWERPFAAGLASASVVAAVLVMHAVATSRGSLPHSLRGQATPAAQMR